MILQKLLMKNKLIKSKALPATPQNPTLNHRLNPTAQRKTLHLKPLNLVMDLNQVG
jgi:hypothetical protein